MYIIIVFHKINNLYNTLVEYILLELHYVILKLLTIKQPLFLYEKKGSF